jgi:hypothetical protein
VTFLNPEDAAAAASAPSGPPATIVPKRAVVQRNGQSIVWTVRENKAVATPVTLGAERLDMIEVKSGIAAGDAIVLAPPETLTDGAIIKVKK